MNTIEGVPTRLASGAWGVKIETSPGRPSAMAGEECEHCGTEPIYV